MVRIMKRCDSRNVLNSSNPRQRSICSLHGQIERFRTQVFRKDAACGPARGGLPCAAHPEPHTTRVNRPAGRAKVRPARFREDAESGISGGNTCRFRRHAAPCLVPRPPRRSARHVVAPEGCQRHGLFTRPGALVHNSTGSCQSLPFASDAPGRPEFRTRRAEGPRRCRRRPPGTGRWPRPCTERWA